MRVILPLGLVIAGFLLIGGSIWIAWYLFEYESDNAGALFGVTVLPIVVGLGAILMLVGMVIALIRFIDLKKL